MIGTSCSVLLGLRSRRFRAINIAYSIYGYETKGSYDSGMWYKLIASAYGSCSGSDSEPLLTGGLIFSSLKEFLKPDH